MKKHCYRGAVLTVLFCLFSASAYPDADPSHAHAAPGTEVQTAQSVPTVRMETDQFELVARLYADELGLYLDDWASNAPILNAKVEVALGELKAPAIFHADHGDYAVADAALLKALHAGGHHALVITVMSDARSDLLTGELEVAGDGLSKISTRDWGFLLLGLMVLSGIGLVLVLIKRRQA